MSRKSKKKTTSVLRLELLESRNLLTSIAGDFNDDGYDDLAIGVPGEDIGPIQAAGAVNVIYGSPSGLKANASGSTPDDQLWHQDIKGVNGVAEAYDRFGTALAVGDFNDDGYDDLAIGVPGEDIGNIVNAGAVNILYGSKGGLRASASGDTPNDQSWHQNSPGVKGGAEAYDAFGSSLAAGDFNNDGHDDLAIGVPYEDVSSITDAGAVNVLYGHESGLTAYALGSTPDDQFWTQNTPSVKNVSEAYDKFGIALAVGDFNNDGEDDLAIGVPNEDVGNIANAGAVNVLYGHKSSGLRASALGSTPNDQYWHQNTPSILGVAEVGDRFGSALAAGDFNDDGEDDLAIGVPYEDLGILGSKTNAGAVNVIYGHESSGLRANALGSTPNDQFWHQNRAGVKDVSESYDYFGFALAAGDFNDDGEDDLAIGVPYEDLGSRINAGAVNVIYGHKSSGLRANALGSTPDDQFWTQNSYSVKGGAETGDGFGRTLTMGDFNDDGEDDLAIGVPYESIGSIINAGAVNVIYGHESSGLRASPDDSTPDDQIWHQGSPGVKGAAEVGDRFGYLPMG